MQRNRLPANPGKEVTLKGNSRLILTIFCIDVNISWIKFTAIICIDDERFYEKIDPKLRIEPAMFPFHRGSLNGQQIKTVILIQLV